MSDLKLMTLGQVVDFTIAYNERQRRTEKAEERDEPTRHMASQAEIDAFFS